MACLFAVTLTLVLVFAIKLVFSGDSIEGRVHISTAPHVQDDVLEHVALLAFEVHVEALDELQDVASKDLIGQPAGLSALSPHTPSLAGYSSCA